MYLSRFGFFRNKTTLEQQQLINYLNLLAANLRNNTLKKLDLACLLQQYFLLKQFLISTKAVNKQKRLALKLKFCMNKRRAKKRLSLKKKQPVVPIEMNKTIKSSPFPSLIDEFPISPQARLNNKSQKSAKNRAKILPH